MARFPQLRVPQLNGMANSAHRGQRLYFVRRYMGFFVRKTTRVGPFRLTFSKSGIGASVGVKGARVTMMPRGTTYVTVGSHGFYYRETLSNRGGNRAGPSPDPSHTTPQVGSIGDIIASADSSDLTESSSERLVQQLNERAKRSNPAWILYVAAVLSVAGLAVLPEVPRMPTLPEATRPFSIERSANTSDEYSTLTARFGEPNSILFAEVDPPGTHSSGNSKLPRCAH
jgi:hypothetical protein